MSGGERPVYLDASALVKLVAEERESPGLEEFLGPRPLRVSSVLARVELLRSVGRSTLGIAGKRRAEDVLSRIALVRLSDDILGVAGELEPPPLRALDALHLATALSIGPDLAEFVTYDRRLADAASGAGLDVVAPR